MTARRLRVTLVALALVVLLLASGAAAVGFGAAAIPPRTVWRVLARELGLQSGGGAPFPTRAERDIVWQLRVPRVILGAVAGAGLAVVGGVLQVVTRNPLADPYLFGVSAGASVGAVTVILYGGAGIPALALPAAAFLGALAALLFVFVAASARGLPPTSGRLVLTGVAVAFILQAVTNFLIVGAANRGAETALFWTMGGLGAARWATVPVPAAVTLIGLLWLGARAPAINTLAFGDDTARGLGVDPARLRLEVFVVAALMTGAIVAVSGGIGFVGLVLPQIARLLVGGDLRRLIPLSAVLGAIFLVGVDVVARTAFAPREIPLGIVTAVLGGVFFLWMMRRREVLIGPHWVVRVGC